MNDNFLLTNDTAVKLYHEYAKEMPIIDYHCHLSPKEIAENKKYKNITEIWLGGDHYKWRAMRINGVTEDYITGDKPDKEKFYKWAETMENSIGNPLYAWTHLELKKYFGIDDVLSTKTAEKIWDKANELLQKDEFSCKELIKRSNVKLICTTDDPVDTLEYHKEILKDKEFNVKVLPTFRPDKAINIENDGFFDWLSKLEVVVGEKIDNIDSLLEALRKRIDFFHETGCRISDHGLDPITFECGNLTEADNVFKKILKKETVLEREIRMYKGQVMLFLGEEYAKRGWTMQIHLGCMRNNNKKMFRLLGPDAGFDSIGDYSYAKDLSRILDKLDNAGNLPKTILYCLNPKDNYVLGSLIGCFQGDGIPGKVQFGSAWWFNDQKEGMIRQMTDLANLGLLSKFVGMLTDSRSFLSYTRHEYFRRILCNLISEWVENNEAPDDMKLLGKMVENISYNNARNYFGIDV